MDELEIKPDSGETHLQERPIEVFTDNSLPAAQIIQEQGDEAENNHAPRFIP